MGLTDMELFAKFNQLETKQKVTLLITVLIGIFAVYLGYDTFFGGTSAPAAAPAPAVASKPAVVASAPAPNPASVGSPSAAGATNNSVNGGSADGSATPPAYAIPAAAKPTPAQLAAIAQSQGMQQQYMNLVNAYQMAQIEQKLADANSKIAESKLSTAKAMVSTQKYVAELPSASGLNMSNDNNNAAPPQVVYVGQQSGQWLAMLSIDGNYIQVNVGTHLQDGSVVTAISDRGVIMDKDGEPAYLPMAKSMQ